MSGAAVGAVPAPGQAIQPPTKKHRRTPKHHTPKKHKQAHGKHGHYHAHVVGKHPHHAKSGG